MRFSGQTVLITGGAGGIGAAVAKRFSSEGAACIISDLDDARCQRTVEQLARQELDIGFVSGDLKDKKFCGQLIERVIAQYGRIDVLVNNAGYMVRGDILDTSDDMWLDSFAVNVHAVFHLCKHVIPHMQSQGGGAIINTSSTWGVYPAPNHLAYNTTKGCLAVFTKNLARDCAPLNIRVNAVCPNEVHTPMIESGFKLRGFDPEQAIAQLNKTVPIGRIAEPEEIASVMAFLASK